MTAIVIVMVMILVVALVVLSVFADDEEEEDWTIRRPGRKGPGNDRLDDLFDE